MRAEAGFPIAKQLDRKLGFWSVFSISVGAMLGSGIFVLPGLAAGIAGPWVSLAYLLAGFMVLPAVLSKAELATAMPVAGGTYVYVDRAMGPWIGTITGIGTWASLSAKTAFALVGLGAYLTLFADPALVKPVSLVVLAGLVFINIRGVSKASTLQTIIVAICLFALAVFGAWGSMTYAPATFDEPFPTGAEGIFAGAAFVFVAYAGVTKICSLAEEIHHPSRNIPRGMLAAHISVMVIYALVAWVIVGNTDPEALAASETPVALAADGIGGPTFMAIMAVISILGLISMSNAGVLSSSRYPFAMGRDFLLPSWTNHLHPKYSTPVPAILLTGAFLFLLVFFLPVVKLAKLASGFKIVVFALVNLSLILLRESHASWYKPTFRAPLYPWLQIVGIIGGLVLLATLGFFAVSGVLGVTVIGTIWYFAYVRKRVGRKSAFAHLWGEAHVLRETETLEEEEERGFQPPRVITPLFGNEKDPERLMQLGAAMVEDNGWLEVMRLEELPEQTMLVASIEEDPEMKAISDAAYRIGDESDVRVAFHDLLTHNAKRAASDHAIKMRAEWMVMAWPEQHLRAIVVRNPMAWWMDHSPCDLAVLKDRGEPAYKRVLVIAKPGPYDSLVVHVADRIAAASGGSLTLLRLVSELAEPEQIAGYNAYHRELSELCDCATTSEVRKTPDALATLAEMSADYDLVVLGAAREHSARTLILGSPEDRMAGAVHCSMLMVKAPRHAVHSRVVPPHQDRFALGGLGPFATWAACGARLEVRSKDEMLAAMAERHSAVLGLPSSDLVLAKLHKREQQQPTALPGGVALIGATKNGIPATSLGIFTTLNQLPWMVRGGSRGIDRVDVCLVVLSPPGDRRIQLWMLGRLARMIPAPGFLASLREARDEGDLLAAVQAADEALDSFLDRSETSIDGAPVPGPSPFPRNSDKETEDP